MALISCPECRKNISDSATACPHCGHPIDPKLAASLKQKAVRNSARNSAFLVGFLVFVGLVIAANKGGSGPPDNRTPEEKRQAENCTSTARFTAERMARVFLERQLKAPASAKYIEEKATYAGGCDFLVVGQVDAQNSFGALIRNAYVVELRYLPVEDKWQRQSLDLQNR